MKKQKSNRKAIIFNKCSDGTFEQPLIDSLLAEIEKKYKKFLVVSKENEIECIINNSLHNDIFAVGGKNAMIMASSLGLHFREKNINARCIFVPACPYNSIPFNDFSAGFGSAMKWCINLGNNMISIRKNSRNNCSVGIVQIDGDDNGWLTAGTASLVFEKEKALFLTSETIFDEDKFCAAVSKKLKKYGSTVIFTSDIIRDAKMKKIGGANQPVSTAISKIILKNLNQNSYSIIVNPGEFFDSEYISKQDTKDARLTGRAAVRLALRTAKHGTNILISNRISINDKNKLSFEVVPLFEAINTPRKLPKKIEAERLKRFL